MLMLRKFLTEEGVCILPPQIALSPLSDINVLILISMWLAGPRWFVAALICDRQLLLDGVLGRISVLAVALVLALGHLVLIVPR